MNNDISAGSRYCVRFSSRFKKNYKKIAKQGKDLNKLKYVISKLALGEEPEAKYRNHSLLNNDIYRECFECHIEPDWLLVYKRDDDELILLLVSTGSHSDLFRG